MPLETAQDILGYFERTRAQRSNFETVWQEIADHVVGRRDFKTTSTQARKRNVIIYDNTSILASSMLKSGIHNFLTNTATPWFGIKPVNDRLLEIDDVGIWFEDATHLCLAAFNRPQANFIPAMHELYGDLVDFCTAGIYVEEVPGIPVRFQAIPLSQLFVAENDHGQIDTIFRCFPLTHRQAVQHFGEKAVPKAALQAEKQPDGCWEYVHLVHPSNDPAGGDGDTRFPWRSVYVSREEKQIIEESGWEELPLLVSRWEKEAGEIYGRGPGWSALPDQKMLNVMSKTLIKAAQKIADPPLFVADDGVILPLRTEPGGVSVIRSGSFSKDPIVPLPIGGNLPLAIQFFEDRKKAVRGAFLHEVLQILQQPFQTAAQVLEIVERAQALISPIVGRLQIEVLEPMIERVFGILLRLGRLPQMPAALAGQEMRVEYVSPVQRSQRMGETRSIVESLGIIGQLRAIEPTVSENIDFDQAARLVIKNTGAPISLLKSKSEVEKSREAQRQLANQQAQQEQLMMAATAAGKAAPAAKALSDMAPANQMPA